MKVAIVRNTPNAQVIRRFGRQNREFYKEKDIEAVKHALSEAGHEVCILEGDCSLFKQIELFSAGCGPHEMVVFNLAYGVQGECRYTHIPSILEQIGVPYVGSGPRAHTIMLDKYLTKVLLNNAGLPTPKVQLIESEDTKISDELSFPLVVKPHSESTSFGLRVVKNNDGLKDAVNHILEEYKQPALVERFIRGTEVNCSVIGNNPPKAFPVVEIEFGDRKGTDRVNIFEVKRDRIAKHVCPARISDSLFREIQELTIKAFKVLGCNDIVRADFRLDEDDNPYILELNSMPSVHKSSSLWIAAKQTGMSYSEMINSIIDAAVDRYFGK